MIITKTPLRISLLGTISDLPNHHIRAGGSNISGAIDKYVYVSVEKRSSPNIEIETDIHEEVAMLSSQVLHPLVRECVKWVGIESNLYIKIKSDVTGYGSGLGASSAIVVGLLNALFKQKEKKVLPPCELFTNAVQVELHEVGSHIGIQDQYLASFGGFHQLLYGRDGSIKTKPIRFERSGALILVSTNIPKTASNVLLSGEKSSNLKQIRALVSDLYSSLMANDVDRIGAILAEEWQLRADVVGSHPKIEQIYETAIGAGALGGHVCGSGGGGYIIFVVPTGEVGARVVGELANLGYPHIPFNFVTEGSKHIGVGY